MLFDASTAPACTRVQGVAAPSAAPSLPFGGLQRRIEGHRVHRDASAVIFIPVTLYLGFASGSSIVVRGSALASHFWPSFLALPPTGWL